MFKKWLGSCLVMFVGFSGMVVAETSTSTLVGTVGDFSYGLISGDAMACYDVFKSVGDITARVGGSATIASYKRMEVYVGAAAPTQNPTNVAVIAGPAFQLNDVAKTALTSILQALSLSTSSIETSIGKAARLKIYGGYDFRYDGTIAGFGFGWAFGG